MGQTLTHGIYLPDEGERNCYNGLAGNWQLLDGAVGTVAEHTTQIAGKAPLVHTHTKSDITDFPVYGNTAGTICEGNDSRLSDARTPVAHTHTKSDVTDLFNSTNTWSANNEYKYLIGLSGAEIWFKQPNIEDITANPDANISKSIIQIYNKTVTQYSGGIADILRTDGSHRLVISCFGFPLNNYAGYYPHTFYFEAKRDGTASFSPSYTNANLGTSTNRWKTLNGINPGALSLPSENASSVNLDPTNWVTDGSNYNSYTPPSDGWLAIQVHSADITDLTGQYVFAGRATGGTDYWPQGGLGVLKMVDDRNAKLIGQIFIPVISGKNYHITIKINKTQTEGSIIYARFYPCLGNV